MSKAVTGITLQTISDGDLAELYQSLKLDLIEQDELGEYDNEYYTANDALASAEYEIVRRWLYEQGVKIS